MLTMKWVFAALCALILSLSGPVAAQDGGCPPTGTTPYDYKQALCMSFLFYGAQRSGKLPSSNRIPWRGDSALNDGSDVGKDLTGGYYDAGDHVKFGFPMAGTVTVLGWGVVEYRDAYTDSGQLEYGLDALKWGTDYFLKAHTASSELYGQVGNGGADHSFWGRPEDMTMSRPSAKIDNNAPGSDLAGETAAALAAASIAFKDTDSSYSSKLLSAAKELFEFANNRRATYDSSITDAGNYYKSWSGFNDELVWGAAWLAKAGESSYLSKAEQLFDEFNLGAYADQFGWDDKRPGVLALLTDLTGSNKYKDLLTKWTNDMMNKPQSPGGMVYIDQWGTLRHAANVAFVMTRAAHLGINSAANKAFALRQLHYILGDNPQQRSFVVGFGNNPPQRPHHRSSSCPDPPASCDNAMNNSGPNPHTLFGAFVGGPANNDNYTDDRNDYVHNEVACDYNAGYTSLLAAVLSDM
uniref:Endoglucanase n=2 Tax=Neomysis intermedia TaxID=1075064 RepID=H3JZW7_9CRUS|nr:cellulase [Neomysis intermedia]